MDKYEKINPKENAAHYLILKNLSFEIAASSKNTGAKAKELQALSVLDLDSKIVTGIDILVRDLPIKSEVPILANKNLTTLFYAFTLTSFIHFRPPFFSSLMKSFRNI